MEEERQKKGHDGVKKRGIRREKSNREVGADVRELSSEDTKLDFY